MPEKKEQGPVGIVRPSEILVNSFANPCPRQKPLYVYGQEKYYCQEDQREDISFNAVS